MNYYEILGISKDASKEEIKKSYRTLALKFHPDKPDGDTLKFQSIKEAYDILMDDRSRTIYNAKTFQNSFRNDWRFQEGWFSVNDHVYDFNSWNNINFKKQPKKKILPNLLISMNLEIKDFFTAPAKTIQYKIKVYCKNCEGSGEFSKEHSGYACEHCNGRGYFIEDREVKIKIPAGVYIGSKTSYKGYGNIGSENEKGNLEILIKGIVPDPYYHIDNDNNIWVLEKISFNDALYGFVTSIKMLDGNNLDMKIKPTELFFDPVKLLPNLGIPISKTKRSNLKIEFGILPATEEEIEELKKHEKIKSDIVQDNTE